MGSPNRRGPKPVLDAEKKRQVISIIATGGTRRSAAGFLRCSPSTITRTAERDPLFAEKLAQVERSQEIFSARTVTRVCQEDRYWRAAAWVLERRLPEVYAKPLPGKYSARDLLQIIGEILEAIQDDLTAQQHDRLREKIHAVLEERVAEEMPFLFEQVEQTLDELTPDEPPQLPDQRPDSPADDQQSAISNQQSAISSQQSAVNNQWSAI